MPYNDGPLLLRATLDKSEVKYNADLGQFTISTLAWNGLGMFWGDVPDYRGKKDLQTYTVVLSKVDKTIDSYDASNAYGATTKVTKIHRVAYGIADRVGYTKTISSENKWVTDIIVTAGQSSVYEFQWPAVILNVAKDKAKAVKKNMKIGILVELEEPYANTGTGHKTPKRNNPIEVNRTTNVIYADIICAVIADGNGVILKTVDVAYR